MSRLEWEKSMLALYTSKKKRMAFASGEIYHDFRGAIESVEDHLDKHKVRRNLKVRFIEELLDRESRDGYLIISLIAHLRREFGNTKPRRALKSLLEEWKEQEVALEEELREGVEVEVAEGEFDPALSVEGGTT